MPVAGAGAVIGALLLPLLPAPAPLALLTATPALAAPRPLATADASQLPNVAGEAATLLTRQHHAEIRADEQRLVSATNELAAVQADQVVSRATAARAVSDAQRAVATLAASEAEVKADQTARASAESATAADRRQLGDIALELYVGPQMAPSGLPDQSLAHAQLVQLAGELISVTSATIGSNLRSDQAAEKAAARAEASAHKAVDDERRARVAAAATERAATARAAADAAVVGNKAAAVAADRDAIQTAAESLAGAVRAIANPVGTPEDGSPSILGVSALRADQLVAWFNYSGYADLTSAPITDLATWYIQEGAAEGVRGDLAFAQALVETGGFSSPDAVDLNNYAGIGHCDTCGSGLAFPSPRLGVRGQAQLLRTFADAGLTAAGLRQPLVLSVLAPESQRVRGCCRTWGALTGVWATDPVYARTILEVYQQILLFTLQATG
jgi:hypothetical protein